MSEEIIQIKTVATTPFKDQKLGTSGLRKKTSAVTEHKHYLPNFFQSVIETICELDFPKGYESSLVIGGDGRYYNETAIMMLIEMLIANSQRFLKANGRNELTVYIGQEGIFSTPAISNFIIKQKCGFGGFILTASHNPGGMDGDFGFKYNSYNGGPSLECITDKIYEKTKIMNQYYRLQDASGLFVKKGLFLDQKNKTFQFNIPIAPIDTFKLTVSVVDPCEDYIAMLKGIFDFEKIRGFFKFNPDFKCIVDSFNAVTGPYVQKIFWQEFGLQKTHQVSLRNYETLPNFGGKHPDPNLIYAEELVQEMMKPDSAFDFGCAFDGDGDRNMILGKNFFVTPSDSLAVLADYAARKGCIPFFDGKVKGVARSMPTSCAVDRVAKARGFQCFETPTGWKYFGNLMDAGKCSICGEESFGTGSDHIREKDGIWAVLAWLSIFAYEGHGNVRKIVEEHWKKYGRSFYQRYDYENVDTPKVDKLFALITTKQQKFNCAKDTIEDKELAVFDNFEYKDIDGTVYPNCGIRMIFKDGSRIIFRQSGTGSVGTTIRIYLEKYMPYTKEDEDKVLHGNNQEFCKPLGDLAIKYTSLINLTARAKPDVIT